MDKRFLLRQSDDDRDLVRACAFQLAASRGYELHGRQHHLWNELGPDARRRPPDYPPNLLAGLSSDCNLVSSFSCSHHSQFAE